MEVLSVRASPLLVPRKDFDVFTVGALPRTDDGMKAALANHKAVLEKAGVSASEALALATSAARSALKDGGLSRGDLSAAITRQLPRSLQAWCEPCKAHHVPEMLFRLIGLRGEFVIRRDGKTSAYVRTDQVLGKRTTMNQDAARRELLRRYLRCFGPSTAADFAAWVGITASEARADWDSLADELIEVDLDGRKTWVHDVDAAVLHKRPKGSGVRLLPPYDAYLDQRDRETLIPERALHKKVWRAIGNPGVVISAGEAVATWRTQKKGKRLNVIVETLRDLSRRACDEVAAQAELLGPFRECTSIETTFA